MGTKELKDAASTAVSGTRPLAELLIASRTRMESLLPRHLSPERMSALALGCLRTNARLAAAAQGSPESFLSAVLMSCRMGLEIGIDAHLVPFQDYRTKKLEVQCIPDYRGLMKIVRNSGEISDITCHLVYEKDLFELELGLETRIRHVPYFAGADRGEVILGYAVAKLKNGSHHCEWMPVDKINEIRDGSPAYIYAKSSKKPTPWIDDYDQMARKTVLRRLCNYLPRSIELVTAQAAMSADDVGASARFDPETQLTTVPESDPFPIIEVDSVGPDAQV